jgi:hypothetical protein
MAGRAGLAACAACVPLMGSCSKKTDGHTRVYNVSLPDPRCSPYDLPGFVHPAGLVYYMAWCHVLATVPGIPQVLAQLSDTMRFVENMTSPMLLQLPSKPRFAWLSLPL